ncbi:transposase, partial [Photobacterium damselae]
FAKKRGIEIGLFCVVHTFGRQLNWNVHFHLSVTRGGINNKTKRWGNIYFNAAMVEQHWKQQVVSFLRDHYHNLNTKHDNYQHIRDFRGWSQFLSSQYSRKWRIHFAYKDHRDNCYKALVLSQIEMIDRLVSHIPVEKNFRAIRYYGFLSNRKRGEALPLVYDLLDQEEPVKPKPLNYAQMMHHQVRIDPYKCILCGGRMFFVKMEMGLKVHELVALRKATIREKRRLRYSL